jgi:sec-independent protein translocase protein TatA
MGLEGISVWQLLIILLIVVLLFGTTKLKHVGGDLGAALKSFRSAMHDGENEQTRKHEESTETRDSLNQGEKKAADAEFSQSGSHTGESGSTHKNQG